MRAAGQRRMVVVAVVFVAVGLAGWGLWPTGVAEPGPSVSPWQSASPERHAQTASSAAASTSRERNRALADHPTAAELGYITAEEVETHLGKSLVPPPPRNDSGARTKPFEQLPLAIQRAYGFDQPQ